MKAVHQPTGVVSECIVKIHLSDAGKQIARTYGKVPWSLACGFLVPR